MDEHMFCDRDNNRLAVPAAASVVTLEKSRSDYWRAYYQANRERLAEQKRAYYQANRERLAEQKRAYYQANRERVAEQQRAYYQANRERLAERKRAYREANRERLAEQKRAYREANRERLAEQKRANAPSCLYCSQPVTGGPLKDFCNRVHYRLYFQGIYQAN